MNAIFFLKMLDTLLAYAPFFPTDYSLTYKTPPFSLHLITNLYSFQSTEQSFDITPLHYLHRKKNYHKHLEMS